LTCDVGIFHNLLPFIYGSEVELAKRKAERDLGGEVRQWLEVVREKGSYQKAPLCLCPSLTRVQFSLWLPAPPTNGDPRAPNAWLFFTERT